MPAALLNVVPKCGPGIGNFPMGCVVVCTSCGPALLTLSCNTEVGRTRSDRAAQKLWQTAQTMCFGVTRYTKKGAGVARYTKKGGLPGTKSDYRGVPVRRNTMPHPTTPRPTPRPTPPIEMSTPAGIALHALYASTMDYNKLLFMVVRERSQQEFG